MSNTIPTMETRVVASAHTQYVVTEDQYQQLINYTRGTDFKNRRDRVTEYFKADITQELALRAIKIGGYTTMSTTLGGALVGLVGGPKGMLIGAGVGFAAGVIFTCIYSSIQLRENYDGWLISIENKLIINKFKELHKDDEVLSEFVDPITENIYVDPVMTPCGHTFEKQELLKWFDMPTGGNTCPTCRTAVKESELTTDFILIGKMKKAYSQLAVKELQDKKEYAEPIRCAFMALHSDLENQALEIMKQVSAHLSLQLNRGKITPQTFSRKMRELTEMYQ